MTILKLIGAVFAPLVMVRLAANRRRRRNDDARRRVETGLVIP